MADILCAVCGEPWDAYGVRHHVDMDPLEAKKFLQGKGCPACGFGTHCPTCGGEGKEKCWRCHGYKRILVETPPVYAPGGILVQPRTERYEVCPKCGGTGYEEDPCPTCRGTGKPPEKTKESELAALESEIEASDEDPITIMFRRGFDF